MRIVVSGRVAALAAASIGLAVGGCATIVKGTTQQVSIVTPNAPGAECTLVSDGIGTKVVTTPATIVLDKSQHNIAVTCKKRCFQDGTGIISSHTESMAAGNIIAGGVIGLGVDAASGAMNRYSAENQIAMVPLAGCKA
ncbi:MAG: hypothetical protein HC834_06680 [Rhodospirillales bacterium]|nr:hypothetical protein [Rhodospirillales bacterium]